VDKETKNSKLYKQQLEQGCQKLGLQLSSIQYDRLINYLQQLKQWNQIYNFTAIHHLQDMVNLHLLDSLSLVSVLLDKTISRIIDVGTGAGLPGLVLAMVMPDKQFTLLDANGKKIRFLKQIKHDLQLDNINLQLTRAEQFKPDQCYDRVISRAFASLPDMLCQTSHLVCQTGQFISMKGRYPEYEIACLPDQFILLNSQALRVPGIAAQRYLISVGLK
jgi:16S rRNA (guanine527-N7)-methyltransferase